MNRAEHYSFHAIIHANQPAAKIMAQMNPEDLVTFGTGTIIVREKLADDGVSSADMLSVMVKRAPGFSPGSGDWEFLAISGDRTKILHRETTGSCFNCHASQKKHDYVFSYEK